ncbi:hypothetical protein [Pseudomonas sp. BBP2017]|uniref:hypothetical protein n=1 Tax=Pseudomonas sp. BBP2017 TaxID=2109731 RepID=UPI0011B24229|nr:hypothetical protein [Pseudomonas sp. BBP2017]
MKKNAFLIGAVCMLSGCSWFNPYDTWGESGYVWCNDRYLKHHNWDAQTESAATRGYMYGLAAALVLQGDRSDKVSRAHWFTDLSNLQPLEPPGKIRPGISRLFTSGISLPRSSPNTNLAPSGMSDFKENRQVNSSLKLPQSCDVKA